MRPELHTGRPGAGGALALMLLLAGCSHGSHATAPARSSAPAEGAMQTFVSKAYGIAIAYPADFSATADFRRSYLSNGAWEAYAGPQSRGRPVVALVLAGSNRVTDAELRIGVSRDPKAVRTCTHPPAAVRPGSAGHVFLDGVRFTRFEASDAAMSHYLVSRSYRTVHDGACYAIDLIVFGTNPAVYDPPRTPPFTREHAFARLRQALLGFRFTR